MKVVAPLLAGATAGALSTVAMSAVMLGAKRAGVTGELPPEWITRRAIDAVSAEPLDDHNEDAIAAVAHLGFGAFAGALFGLLTTRTGAARGSPAIAAFAGMIYATGIWLVSYQGWVPALGIMPPASSDRRGRVVTMLAAHWVYGAALGVLVTLFRRWRSSTMVEPPQSPAIPASGASQGGSVRRDSGGKARLPTTPGIGPAMPREMIRALRTGRMAIRETRIGGLGKCGI